MQLKNLTKTTVKTLRKDVNAALAEVAAKHGLTFDIGTIRFSGSEARMKVTANTGSHKTELQVIASGHAAKHNCSISGNKDFPGWTLVEFNNRNKKFKWVATDENGKQFRMNLSSMKLRFSK